MPVPCSSVQRFLTSKCITRSSSKYASNPFFVGSIIVVTGTNGIPSHDDWYEEAIFECFEDSLHDLVGISCR